MAGLVVLAGSASGLAISALPVQASTGSVGPASRAAHAESAAASFLGSAAESGLRIEAKPSQGVDILITNGNSNKCLDLRNGRVANGTPIQQWTCTGHNNQLWTFVYKGTVHWHGLTWGKWNIVSALAGNYCLDARGNSTKNGTKLQLWKCGTNPPHANQEWLELHVNGTDAFTWILNLKASIARNRDVVMDVVDSGRDHGMGNGDRVQLWQNTDLPNQWWLY